MGRYTGFAQGALAAGIALGMSACSHIPMTHPRALTVPTTCTDFTISLYFNRDSAKITGYAREVLKGARVQARNCQVASVEVVGLSDSIGAPGANMELSRKRALEVTAALAHEGFRDVTISAVAVGEAGSVTPQGVAPLRRRADINFHLTAN